MNTPGDIKPDTERHSSRQAGQDILIPKCLTPKLLTPQWSVSPWIRSAFSLRAGGVSEGGHGALNLGTHVGDDLSRVKENRQRLKEVLGLPTEPLWLKQVHGTTVFHARASHREMTAAGVDGETHPPEADAVITAEEGLVLAVQVADCLPILFATDDGRWIGAAHAGWRGLVSGVIEATVSAMQAAAMQAAAMQAADAPIGPENIHAWLGPCIGQQSFEVGAEVREAFLAAGDPDGAFVENSQGRWQADLVLLAQRRLQRLGVTRISGGQWCTASEPERFFSHRRESQAGGQSGRMAALIWMEPRSAMRTR